MVLLVIGASFGVGYWQGTKRNQVKATQAENAANVAKGERDAFKAQAEAKDQEIAAKDAGLESAKASLRRAEQELARSKVVRPSVVSVPLPAIPGTPMGNVGVEDGWRDLVGRQEAVIQAQGEVIKLQDVKITDLTISRNAWKASSEAGRREAAGLRIALEAQKSLTRNALWRGRFQGLAIGLGSGYVIGRAQR
jgi:hypothetical protein